MSCSCSRYVGSSYCSRRTLILNWSETADGIGRPWLHHDGLEVVSAWWPCLTLGTLSRSYNPLLRHSELLPWVRTTPVFSTWFPKKIRSKGTKWSRIILAPEENRMLFSHIGRIKSTQSTDFTEYAFKLQNGSNRLQLDVWSCFISIHTEHVFSRLETEGVQEESHFAIDFHLWLGVE